jgi:hypothetical protein
MFQHTLLIKFTPGTTEEQIKALSDGLHSLTQISGVLSVTCGKDLSKVVNDQFIKFDFGAVVSQNK